MATADRISRQNKALQEHFAGDAEALDFLQNRPDVIADVMDRVALSEDGKSPEVIAFGVAMERHARGISQQLRKAGKVLDADDRASIRGVVITLLAIAESNAGGVSFVPAEERPERPERS